MSDAKADTVIQAAIPFIEEGQRLRGWIANGYAQIEFMLGDLILRSMQFSAYKDLPETLPHGAPDRVKRLRRIISANGPLKQFADQIECILVEFESNHESRNLLAHGFCTYLYTTSGDEGLQFQKFHRTPDRTDARLVRTFRLEDLRSEQDTIVALSERAIHLFAAVHDHFGWIDRPYR